MEYAETALYGANVKWNQTFDNYTAIVPLNVQFYLSESQWGTGESRYATLLKAIISSILTYLENILETKSHL